MLAGKCLNLNEEQLISVVWEPESFYSTSLACPNEFDPQWTLIECSLSKPPHYLQVCTENVPIMVGVVCKTINSPPKVPLRWTITLMMEWWELPLYFLVTNLAECWGFAAIRSTSRGHHSLYIRSIGQHGSSTRSQDQSCRSWFDCQPFVSGAGGWWGICQGNTTTTWEKSAG